MTLSLSLLLTLTLNDFARASACETHWTKVSVIFSSERYVLISSSETPLSTRKTNKLIVLEAPFRVPCWRVPCTVLLSRSRRPRVFSLPDGCSLCCVSLGGWFGSRTTRAPPLVRWMGDHCDTYELMYSLIESLAKIIVILNPVCALLSSSVQDTVLTVWLQHHHCDTFKYENQWWYSLIERSALIAMILNPVWA